MGLALLIVVLKALGLRRGGGDWNDAARFWVRIFGLNFAMGVVTGIPMEFQFGTNWARFSRFAGDVVGQTLAMEGVFAFFLESCFLWLFLIRRESASGPPPLPGRGRPLRRELGSPATSSSPPTPSCSTRSATRSASDGTLRLADFSAFILNPWALAQYAHNMTATVVTASFVVAALGAFYTLQGIHLTLGPPLPEARHDGGAHLQRARGVSHRGHQAKHGGPVPAHRPGRDGGALRERGLRGDQHHRAAERAGAQARQPDPRPRHPFLPGLRLLPLGRPGPRRVSRAGLARQHRAPLLRLPHHGGARHDPHRDHGRREPASLARAPGRRPGECCGS